MPTFSLSPDGGTVFFSARNAGRSEPWSTNFDIYGVPVDGHRAPVDLTRSNLAWDAEPKVSPDGHALAWRAQKRPGFEADRFAVMVMNLATHATHEVDPGWDRSVSSLSWFPGWPDAGCDRRGCRAAARVRPRRAERPGLTPLTGDGHVTGVRFAAGHVFYLRDALDSPAQLWRLVPGGAPERLTHVGGNATGRHRHAAVPAVQVHRLEPRDGAWLRGTPGRLRAGPRISGGVPDPWRTARLVR